MNIIIFSNKLEVIGGAEDYVIRKAKTLIENKHEVIVLAPVINEYYREILKGSNIPFLINEKLDVSPQYLWKKERESLIILLEKKLGFREWDCVESHQVYPMLWAELFSIKLKIPNFIYLLSEEGNYPRYHKKLLNAKIDNKMLIGCNSMTIPIVAEKTGAEIKSNNVFLNISVIPDEIKEQNYTLNIDRENEFVITTIARLDKYYIRYLIEELLAISKKENIQKLVLVIVGAGFYEKEFKSLAKESENDNLRIIFTGTLKPLPKEIFQISNLYIGMGTTVVLSAAMKCPTLTVDPFTNKSPGFFGEHTSNFGFKDGSNELKNFSHYIMEVLKNKNTLNHYGKVAFECFQNQFDNATILREYLQILDDGKNIEFSESIVYSSDLLEKIQSLIYKITGYKLYMKFRNYLLEKKRFAMNNRD